MKHLSRDNGTLDSLKLVLVFLYVGFVVFGHGALIRWLQRFLFGAYVGFV